jgi:hypothetical protein
MLVKNGGNKLPWWCLYPLEHRKLECEPDEASPNLMIGLQIRLRKKPEQIRIILDVEWHRHRYEYCYYVETTQIWQESIAQLIGLKHS